MPSAKSVRRHVVVGGRDRAVGAADAAAGEPQPLERLRARDLVDEVEVDEEQVVADHVLVPDLLVQGLRPITTSSGRRRRRTGSRPARGRRSRHGGAGRRRRSRCPRARARGPAVDHEAHPPLLDHANSLEPASCRGSSPVPAPGSSTWRETAARWPGVLGRQHGVPAAPGRAPPRARSRRAPRARRALVQAQQLRQRQVEPRGDALGDRHGGRGLAALDLREHRRGDPGARRRGRAATGPDPRAGSAPGCRRRPSLLCTLSRTNV